jgi:hypothetical protein
MEITELIFAIGGLFLGILISRAYFYAKGFDKGFNTAARAINEADELNKNINWD